MKKIFLSLMALVGVASFAQEEKSRVDFSVGVASAHLWRGIEVSEKPIVSALTTFNLTKDGALQVGTWGGFSLTNTFGGDSYKEINYYIQYAKGGFSIGLWDLYNFSAVGTAKSDIFNYKQKETRHLLDLRLNYFCGAETPLYLEADFILYGAGDTRMERDGGSGKLKAKQKLSTYLQVAYDIAANNGIVVKPFIGAGFALNGKDIPMEEDDKEKRTNRGFDLYGGEKNFSVVNLGFTVSKTVALGSYKLPLSATTMWNPAKKWAQVQLAATLF